MRIVLNNMKDINFLKVTSNLPVSIESVFSSVHISAIYCPPRHNNKGQHEDLFNILVINLLQEGITMPPYKVGFKIDKNKRKRTSKNNVSQQSTTDI